MNQWLGIFFQENLITITKLSNILKNEKSPYLQQHKDNPVDWFPWNKETLGKANGLMWGSKVIAKSIGLAVATSIYLNYGLQIGFLALAILMLIVVVVPILSIERPIHNSSLTLIQIKDETLKGLKNPKAKWAVLFLIISSIGNGVYEPIISKFLIDNHNCCLLYTSDAADE